MIRTLYVFMNDVLMGRLFDDDNLSEMSFQYDEKYINNSNSILLSVSMPFQKEKFDSVATEAFFSNLLPDSTLRENLAKILNHSSSNTFAILSDIGYDCAGAISLRKENKKSDKKNKDDFEILTEERLQNLIQVMRVRPLLAKYDNVRLSLAGAQSKIAVGYDGNNVVLIKNGNPTSHILKPIIELPNVENSVYNEFYCMKLSKAVGFDTPDVSIIMVKNIPCYIVKRYDRKIIDGKLVRVHQEDFCQALGVYPLYKYEIDGGPSVDQCKWIIERCCDDSLNDLTSFYDRLFFNFVIGNSDGHGKNFSLLHNKENKKVSLAPCYDLMSTEIYPFPNNLAMKINSKDNPKEINFEDFLTLVPSNNIAQKKYLNHLKELSKKIKNKAEKITNELNKSVYKCTCYDQICNLIFERIDKSF